MEPNTIEAFRLSPQQRRLLTTESAGIDRRAQATVRVDGPLDRDRLRQSIDQVIGRHEALRTTFRKLHGLRVPFQVVCERCTAQWQWIDSTSQEHDPEAIDYLRAVQDAERRALIDLESGPVLRVCGITYASGHHRIVITAPALCADSMTMSNVVREIGRSYASQHEDDPPLQYADFAAWQNELVESQDADADAARSYWTTATSAVAQSVDLPFQALPSPDAQSPREIVVMRHRLEPTTAAMIETGSVAAAVSPRAYLMACLQVVVARLTGSAEPTVFEHVPGRKYDETRAAMGLFATAAPVASRCDPERPFRALAADLARTLADVDTWQDYLCESASSEREAERAARGVHFEIVELPEPVEAGDLRFTLEEVDARIADFTLKVTCNRGADGWSVAVAYDPGSYRTDDVERFIQYFETTIAQAAAQPSIRLEEVDLVGDVERRRLLVDWNETTAPFAPENTIQSLFEAQVRRTPTRPAITFDEHALTYAALNERANQLAHHLRRRGVASGTNVGLAVDRSADMIVALLGILKAGGAYVPLNAEHPSARLEHQLRETGATILVTQRALEERLARIGSTLVCADAPELASEPTDNPDITASAGDIAYVLYTSGSTGTPKGVAVRHRNLLNYAQAIARRLELEPDVPLAFATVSTITADLGNTAIFPSLISGGCLHVIAYDVAGDGAAFAAYVAKYPIDVLKIVPSHLKALLAARPAGDLLPTRFLIAGGEALSWDLVDLVRSVSNCRVFNHYGPTETTVGSLVCEVDAAASARRLARTVPIGRPIANTRVYVLDGRMRPVPTSVAGELFIGGAGVAAGYVGRPDLTAERFVADPFAPSDAGPLYRTGDIVRYLADGNVEFVGRRDHQIKLRGFRVELGEIEAALVANPVVQEAVVVARGDTADGQQLVGYLVARRGATIDVETIRSGLSDRLPDYMVPPTFVVLDTLPLTRNGKVDRAALPAPQADAASRRAFIAPRTPVEESVAAVWRELLRCDRIGVDDDFFRLGGHSLLVTQAVSRLRSQFTVDLPLRTFFESPTVGGVAEAIERMLHAPQDETAIAGMLAHIETLSDEEAAALLQGAMRDQPNGSATPR